MHTYNTSKTLCDILNIEFKESPNISDETLSKVPEDAIPTSTKYTKIGTQCSVLVRKGVPLTEEHRQKISDSQKGVARPEQSIRMIGNSINKGKIFSKETRSKMSNSKIENKNRLGIKHSSEMKKTISEKTSIALKGKPKNKIACPHCNKIGGVSNMRRYHFDHCKKRTIPQ